MRTATFLIIIHLVACTLPAVAQSRVEAQQDLEALKALIARDEDRLKETMAAEKDTEEKLNALNRQIALREELVRNIQRRLEDLTAEADTLEANLLLLEDHLANLRREYQGRASHAYRHGRMHDLSLILAAESINQMLIRIRYLNRFADQRRGQLAEINAASTELTQKRAALEETVEKNRVLLVEAEQERALLNQQQAERAALVQVLRSQRTTLEASLARNRTMAEELTDRIQAAIAAEAARRNAVTRNNDADFSALGGSFQQNKGSLPWPADGVIIEPYGEIVNPVHGTVTPNPGILLATPAQAEVRAVFDGHILAIDFVPGMGTYIIVEHGEYQSVYSNFSLTYVEEGDSVQAGQVIGRAGTEAEPKGQGVFFGLFKQGQEMDPTPWLARR